MIKIEIKNRYTGSIIFEYTKENNTIKKTVEKAIEEKVNLSYSDLSYSNLRGSDLSYSDLSSSNLRGSDLRGSDLSSSNLIGSDLRGSNLRGSDLSGSNLRDSDLRGSNLRGSDLRGSDLSGSDLSGSNNKEKAYLPIFCRWSHSIRGDKIKIGCKEKTIEEWEMFFNSNEEWETKRNTEEFKQIQATYEACKAYLTFLNK